MYYAKYRVSRKPRKIFRYIGILKRLEFDFQTHFLFQAIFYNLSFLGFKIWIVEKYIEDIFFERTYLKKAEFSNLLSYFFFFLMSEFSAALFKGQLFSEYFDFCHLAKRIEPVGFSNEIKL